MYEEEESGVEEQSIDSLCEVIGSAEPGSKEMLGAVDRFGLIDFKRCDMELERREKELEEWNIRRKKSSPRWGWEGAVGTDCLVMRIE